MEVCGLTMAYAGTQAVRGIDLGVVGEPSMNFLTFACTSVWMVMSCTHASASVRVGSSPWTSSYAVSR